jgi:GTP-binding protein Era
MTNDSDPVFDFETDFDLLPSQDELPPDHRSGFVAVVGRPNVGKSTLINGWLGQKIAIVSDKPQTTRQKLTGILTRPNAQVVFLDTPGLHKPQHRLGQYMVDQARNAIPEADVICLVVDASEPPGRGDELIVRDIKQKAPDVPVVLVINKVDLVPPDRVLTRVTAYRQLVPSCADWVVITALAEAAREDAVQRVLAQLPLGPRYYPADQVTDLQERFIAAELIREQVLRQTHQEVPHSVAIVVQEFAERSENLTYISATIYVERDSQKKIILGKNGQAIKQIGQAARTEIEELIGTKVYLELWVKVWENWRKSEDRLRWLGYAG